MFSVGVFCGSRVGARDDYMYAAQAFGHTLATRGFGLVYGGGCVGLMGAVADAALEAGGHVVGVIPDFLSDHEVAHQGLQECLIVDDLFERKALMIEHSDAFVALPGGIGTLDEILEVIAWRQLQQLRQPIGFLNTAGFFDPWMALVQHFEREGFVSVGELDHVILEADPDTLLDELSEPDAP